MARRRRREATTKGKEASQSDYRFHGESVILERGTRIRTEGMMVCKELGLINLHTNGVEAQTRGDHEGKRGQPKRCIIALKECVIRGEE